VAGTTLAEAMDAVRALHLSGIGSALDSLGENVTSASEALAAADVYHELLDGLAGSGLNANMSVKLTQIGMDFSLAKTGHVMAGLVEHAARVGSFVRIDMEDSSRTESTISLTEQLNEIYGPNLVGTVIQAYLYRSEADVERLLQKQIRIRLCKGAYHEPPSVAFPKKRDVDENYFRLAVKMLSSGVYHGLATHDESLINRIVRHLNSEKIDRDSFEFQMLFGVRRDLQHDLVDQGFRVRVYVPFGDEWYPYFMRRLAERPANLLFVVKNMLRA
jgi:proline dehydrogenase